MRVSTKAILFTILLLPALPALAQSSCANPPAPVRAYLQAHADWRLRVLEDFDKDSQDEWRKYNKNTCPGFAAVDLDGRGSVYAVMLARPGSNAQTQKTVIAGRREWENIFGPAFVSPVPEFLIRIPPGKYQDQYDFRHITLRHDAVVAGEWDAGAVAYYLSGGKLKKFQYTE